MLAPLSLPASVPLLVVLALGLAGPAHGQDEDEGPTRAEIEAAVERLRDARASRDEAVLEQALLETRVADRKVIREVTRSLDAKSERVRRAALESLRWTEHEDALEALHRTWRREEELREHPELGQLLAKAIGQHGSPDSVELLAEGLFDRELTDELRPRVVARVYALGHIRDALALETLLDELRHSPRRNHWRAIAAIRASLVQLAGVDHGESVERWVEWWQGAEREFEMAKEPPLMLEELQGRWDRFWGIERPDRRNERREDRGGDGRGGSR